MTWAPGSVFLFTPRSASCSLGSVPSPFLALSQLPILSYILDLPTKRNYAPSVKCQLNHLILWTYLPSLQITASWTVPPTHTHNSLTLSFNPHHVHHFLPSSDFTSLLGHPRFPGFHFNYFLENALNFLPITTPFILACTHQPSLPFCWPQPPPCLPIHPSRSSQNTRLSSRYYTVASQ